MPRLSTLLSLPLAALPLVLPVVALTGAGLAGGCAPSSELDDSGQPIPGPLSRVGPAMDTGELAVERDDIDWDAEEMVDLPCGMSKQSVFVNQRTDAWVFVSMMGNSECASSSYFWHWRPTDDGTQKVLDAHAFSAHLEADTYFLSPGEGVGVRCGKDPDSSKCCTYFLRRKAVPIPWPWGR